MNIAESMQAELVGAVIAVGSGLGVESIIGRENTAPVLTPFAMTVYVPSDRSFMFSEIVVSDDAATVTPTPTQTEEVTATTEPTSTREVTETFTPTTVPTETETPIPTEADAD